MNDSLKDKNVIITEMMHGVGFEVALEFAKRGIHFLENIPNSFLSCLLSFQK